MKNLGMIMSHTKPIINKQPPTSPFLVRFRPRTPVQLSERGGGLSRQPKECGKDMY